MRFFLVLAIAALAVAACLPNSAAGPSPAPSEDLTLRVLSVSRNVVELPQARVEISNTGARAYRYVTIRCLLYRADKTLIGPAEGYASNLGPGVVDIIDAMAVEQHQTPASATCRIAERR